MARICIVTPGAIGSTPRVVKEADALHQAGHEVHVISTRTLDAVDLLDDAILAKSGWSSERVDLRRPAQRRLNRLGQVVAQALHAVTGLAAPLAYSALDRALARRVMRRKADLYIAHYVTALPLAAKAARRHAARYAFDAEDFHPGDWPNEPAYARINRLIHQIEGRWLPGCAYVTAASPGIGDAYRDEYGLAAPHVVLNVFPKSHAPAGPSEQGATQPRPTVYWYSQTIGPHRGLECAVRALALARTRPHLHLRGTPGEGFDKVLAQIAADARVSDRLHLHPPASPLEMERLAAVYDIGLVGETGATRNRSIALTNKQFTYLLAGMPMAMSDIPGHRAFAATAPGAVELFRPDSPEDLARVFDHFLEDPARLATARRAAFRLGQERFNWDVEKEKLLRCVDAALAPPYGQGI